VVLITFLKSTLPTCPEFFQQKFCGFVPWFGTCFITGQRAEIASVELWLGEMSKNGSFSPPFAASLDGEAIRSLTVRVLSITGHGCTFTKNFRGIGRGFGFHKSAKFG